MVRSFRVACLDAGKMVRNRLSLVDGFQKCGYWIAHASLLNSVLGQVWEQTMDGVAAADVVLRPEIAQHFVDVSLCFLRRAILIGAGSARRGYQTRVMAHTSLWCLKEHDRAAEFGVACTLRHCMGTCSQCNS